MPRPHLPEPLIERIERIHQEYRDYEPSSFQEAAGTVADLAENQTSSIEEHTEGEDEESSTERQEPAVEDGSLSELDKVQRNFWQGLKEQIAQRPNTPLYVDEPKPTHFLPQTRNLPSDSVHYVFVSNTVQDYLQVKLQIEDEDHDIFNQLKNHEDEIESDIGQEFELNTGETYDTVVLQRDGNIKTNPNQWDEYHEWLIEYGEIFDEVFSKYL